MKLERFYSNYPAGPELEQTVSFEQKWVGKYPSNINYLATTLANMAGTDLEHEGEFMISGYGWPNDKDTKRTLLEDHRDVYNAVVLGSTVISLEETAQTGHFNVRDLVGKINTATQDSILDELNVPEWALEKPVKALSDEELYRFNKTLEYDQTYTLFLQQPFLMPEDMSRFLREIGFIGGAGVADLIQNWKERAQHLAKRRCEPLSLNSRALKEIEEAVGDF